MEEEEQQQQEQEEGPIICTELNTFPQFIYVIYICCIEVGYIQQLNKRFVISKAVKPNSRLYGITH
jgi:hypothetical protein